MLFYVVVIGVSLFATLIASLIYKAVAEQARLADASLDRITITDSAQEYQSRDYQRKRVNAKACKSLATQPVQEYGMVFSKWGAMSPDGFSPCLNQDTAWVVREKRLLSMCESYAARRSDQPDAMTLDMISKPFRRKVSL